MSATPKCPRCDKIQRCSLVDCLLATESVGFPPAPAPVWAPSGPYSLTVPAPILDFEKAGAIGDAEVVRSGNGENAVLLCRAELERQAAEAVERGRQQEKARIVTALKAEAERCHGAGGERVMTGVDYDAAADFVERS